ncbi:hypothetical protein [Nakamurella panacisegetis]|nr:hypothetical protein [Nakamurella panacisegetis]
MPISPTQQSRHPATAAGPHSRTADADEGRPRHLEVVSPSIRVNVAFPFSAITVAQPDREFSELLSIVAGLADLLGGLAPGSVVADLQKRAAALRSGSA